MSRHPASSSLRVAILATLVFAAGVAHAQSPGNAKYPGRLIGVYDERTGDPVDSAEVRDMQSGSFAFTTSTGTLSLFFVDTAGSLVRIRKVGYLPVTMFIDNSPSNAIPMTITLDPVAKQLPTVLTMDSAPHYRSPALNGFEERRKAGGGYFVSEADLRKQDDRPMANVLRAQVPSIQVLEMIVDNQRISVAASRRMQSGGSACPVDVYVDGSLYSGSSKSGGVIRGGGKVTATGNDLNQLKVADFAGVEFHNPADTPPEYNRTVSGCGVLLLWTREK